MENTKFSSQISVALEQVTLHLRRTLNPIKERAKNAVGKMREMLAGSLDAVLEANGKITKFSAQLFVALEQATLHLRRTLNPIPERAKDAIEKMRELLAGSLDAVLEANGKITKFSAQLFVALEQATLHLRRTLNPIPERAKDAIEKMRELLAGSLDAVLEANGKITKFSAQLFVALKQVTLHLRRTLNSIPERAKDAIEKMRELLAGSLDAVLEANGKITKFSAQLFVALKQVTVQLRQVLNPLTEHGKNVLEKTRRLQEASRARENDLRELLATSVDAVVVTNLDHRFIAANPNALHLFGVSETNIRQFTIDAFLFDGEILRFDESGLPFISREETQGECRIRRLTGNLRIAEYIFVANFMPFRHLFVFRNDREWVPRRRVAAAG